MTSSIKGYKAFNNMMDRYGNTYEVGNTYKVEGPIKFQQSGFHFCKNLEDVFRYYDGFDENTIICEVEGYGEFDKYDDTYYDYYNMYAISSFKIIKALNREEILDNVLNKGLMPTIRLISGYYLTDEELNIILNKYNDPMVIDFINYFQKNDLNAFVRKRELK